jgi:hypothetical protein
MVVPVVAVEKFIVGLALIKAINKLEFPLLMDDIVSPFCKV